MFDIKCPNKNDFELYLNGELSELKTIAFDNHLNNCELCKAAISGFKYEFLHQVSHSALENTGNSTKHMLWRLMPYAASVIILIAVIFSFSNWWGFGNKALVTEMETISTHHKTLMHKCNSDYWYIGDEQKIAYNDQLIQSDELTTIGSDDQVSQVFIQVESDNSEIADAIIHQIKEKQNVPVFVFSKYKGLKKN